MYFQPCVKKVNYSKIGRYPYFVHVPGVWKMFWMFSRCPRSPRYPANITDICMYACQICSRCVRWPRDAGHMSSRCPKCLTDIWHLEFDEHLPGIWEIWDISSTSDGHKVDIYRTTDGHLLNICWTSGGYLPKIRDILPEILDGYLPDITLTSAKELRTSVWHLKHMPDIWDILPTEICMSPGEYAYNGVL